MKWKNWFRAVDQAELNADPHNLTKDLLVRLWRKP